MSYQHRQNHQVRVVLRSLNISFLVLFGIDVIFRIVSYGKNYFKKSLSMVDIAMIGISLLNYMLNVNFDEIMNSDFYRIT